MYRILIFLLICKSAYAQNNQPIDPNQRVFENKCCKLEINQARQIINDNIRNKKIPGLSISIAKNDLIIWAEGFGYADLENKIPVTINSKFRIGSISKTLTAMGIGKLLDSKQLDLSDDIRKYVTYFPKKKFNISVADLASHQSGIRDYDHNKNEYQNTINYNSTKASVSVFQNDSLLFEPGTRYSYSTYNYTLLSAVVEGVTSQSFIDYMQESIITPLKLLNTTPDYLYNIIDKRVRFYDSYQGNLINSLAVDNSNKWAGGGYLSTPIDLIKICQSLLKNDLISEVSKQRLWTPAILKSGKVTNYGIGWRIDKDEKERTYVHHGGSSVGGRSFLLMYPKDGLIIAVTSNLGDSFNQDFIMKIADLFH